MGKVDPVAPLRMVRRDAKIGERDPSLIAEIDARAALPQPKRGGLEMNDAEVSAETAWQPPDQRGAGLARAIGVKMRMDDPVAPGVGDSVDRDQAAGGARSR